MILAIAAVIAGLVVLVWSADRFVEGAAATANHLGLPSLLIGVLVIGFGTSAPELAVSVIAASEGNPGLALGNAYGSNITNIGLVVGMVALLSSIRISSQILKRELPVLLALTGLAGFQLYDGELTRLEGWILLGVLALLLLLTIIEGLKGRKDALAVDTEAELGDLSMPLGRAVMWLLVGLVLLVAASRLLVWGAVTVAQSLGISDLVIGLTVVAIGTSLPELASAIAAVRKNEHDLVLGNILGSGIFNTLAVVGIAAAVHPLSVEAIVLHRDWMVMAGLTLALFAMSLGLTGHRMQLKRPDGAILLTAYIAYTGYLVSTSLA